MSYVMMMVSGWDRGAVCVEPTVDDLCNAFNISASDVDKEFGLIFSGNDCYTVSVTPEAAKKMFEKHVDNTLSGQGPFVSGPYSSPHVGPA